MIEWIQILEVLAVVMASLGAAMFFAVFIKFILNMIPKRKATPKVQTKEQKENITMSKEAREGVTFNDIFMFMIAVPLVLLWVGFAGFVIHTGLNNSSVLDNTEAYTTLIAILGGPALLIIKDALDVWKQEQAEKTAFYQVKAQSVIDFNKSTQNQAQLMESNEQAHVHKVNKK